VKYDELQWPTSIALRCAIIKHLRDIYGERLRDGAVPAVGHSSDTDECLSLSSPTSVSVSPEIVHAPTNTFVVHYFCDTSAENSVDCAINTLSSPIRPKLNVKSPPKALKLSPQELEALLHNNSQVSYVETVPSPEGIQNWRELCDLNTPPAKLCTAATRVPRYQHSAKSPAAHWGVVTATP
jgi:hypothetical protein